MNVSELARSLRVNTKELLEILPQYGFDVGAKAVKIDNKVADQIARRWRFIKKEIEDKKRLAAEEKKRLEKELRKQSGQTVRLPALVTVREFAERLGLPVTQVILELMKNGILANQNQNIDYDTAAIMAEEMGFSPQKEAAGKTVEHPDASTHLHALEEAMQKGEHKQTRPPVIVVMGHVDHGKTKLLDAIRHTDVVATESGGITQHIGAYQTRWKDPKTKEERAITFIDTPGHEAFTVMRSRGAKVADIAILVVAADDGVKPQTEEVIQIIRAAKLPFIVAINKIDKDGADIDRVKSQLSERQVISEEWGGDVPMVPISAKQQKNIDKLLDMVLLVADMQGERIQADPDMPAAGTIIESHVDKHTGPVATVLVQAGTLKKGDPLIVNGEQYGKVRAMRNYKAEQMEEALPSTPAQIIGFKVAPRVGDILDVSRADTAEMIDVRQKRAEQTGAEQHNILQTQTASDDDEKKKTVNVLIKADVLGSLEAIIGSLEKMTHEEVGVKVVGKGLGNITDDDVRKAESGTATILGFHVNLTSLAETTMRDKNMPFHKFDVIYDLFDWVKGELQKLLAAEMTVREIGRLKILAVFRTEKSFMVLGGRVEDGKIQAGCLVRVKRKGEIVGQGKIANCQTGKQDVKEVPSGTECGVRFEGKVKVEEGDVLEAYVEERKERKLELG